MPASHSDTGGGRRNTTALAERDNAVDVRVRTTRSPLIVAASGATRHGSIAVGDDKHVLGVCELERVTRVRGAGFDADGWPDVALDTMLERLNRTRGDIRRLVLADANGESPEEQGSAVERVGHHFAHACTAYLSSSFSSAAIVVCDHEAPRVSIWHGEQSSVRRIEWDWDGAGFADTYSRCARAFGFHGPAGDQRFESLSRLQPDARHPEADRLISSHGQSLVVTEDCESAVERLLSAAGPVGSIESASLAAALQGRIVELFVEFLREVRRRIDVPHLCLGGSFFYHSVINTAARRAGAFTKVFVPVDPGNGGLAVGALQSTAGHTPRTLSAFLGPAYSHRETKETLDNCKLQYEFVSEAAAIDAARRALVDGRLVGWFEGGMEWGPRALGARSILANPFSPYVLENLNAFLKRREPWRGYAMSGTRSAVDALFEGPTTAPFMECDFRPRDPAVVRHALPLPSAAIRVHTVEAHTAPPAFGRLLEVFGDTTGMPLLINTSFNAFHEPIVCSPRDAIRAFYASGLDVLVMNQFVIRK